jgi:putative NADH-flavin reductase
MNNKTITVIGANGRTGIEIVNQALEKEWMVKALVREKQKMGISNPHLHIIEGNPLNYVDVVKAIKETDAVYVALNIGRKTDMPWSKVVSPFNLLGVSMMNTVTAMKENGVKRVISVSAWGVGDSYKEVNWMFRFLINKTNVGFAYKGHEDQERILRESGLDWTAVRPVALTKSENQRSVKVSFSGEKKLNTTISRKDVAKFMLEIIDDKKYFQTTPSISLD